MTADESGARGARDARGLVERDYDLVRLAAPARGDTIHRSTCRYAQKPNALVWAWADKHEHEDWAVTAPWLRACRTCKPPSPAGRRTNVCTTMSDDRALSRESAPEPRPRWYCPDCAGKGYVHNGHPDYAPRRTAACARCGGTGKVAR